MTRPTASGGRPEVNEPQLNADLLAGVRTLAQCLDELERRRKTNLPLPAPAGRSQEQELSTGQQPY